MENTTMNYLEKLKAQVDYAHANGMEVGGYDLIDLERGLGGYGGNVGDVWDGVDPTFHNLTNNACFASGWYDNITGIMMSFINYTGISMVETDGPYGGQECGALNHSHHNNLEDSIYMQTTLQGAMYSDLVGNGVFINQPDTYFFQGGNKEPLGYIEAQFSLPRWEDITISRQSMFDDTYRLLPTQGWMFLPLVEYEAGGDPAIFEPLQEHLLEYDYALAQYFGSGVAACYRGWRLYDSNETKTVVQKWVNFFKTYRDILISDIVHVRRPDMQGLDAILHVNPFITNRGLAMVYNPTGYPIQQEFNLPVYYTGISKRANIRREEGEWKLHDVKRDYSVHVHVDLPPQSVTWYLIQDGE